MWNQYRFEPIVWKYLKELAGIVTPEFVKAVIEEHPDLLEEYELDEDYYMRVSEYPSLLEKFKERIGDRIMDFTYIGFIQDIEEFRGNEIVKEYGKHTFAQLISSALESITEVFTDAYKDQFLYA